MTDRVFLSQRNVLTLLSKLNRAAAGEQTACLLYKNDKQHSLYPQTMWSCGVHATEGEQSFETDGYEATIDISRESLNALLTVGTKIVIENGDEAVEVTSVEDAVYYAERQAGPMHPADDPGLRSNLH